MTEEKTFNQLLKMLLILMSALVFVRLFPALWGALAFGVLVFPVLLLGFFAYRYWKNKRVKKLANNHLASSLEQKIAEAQQQARHFRTTAGQIQKSRLELAQQLEKTKDPTPAVAEKSQRLLQELDEEQALRNAKASFFETLVVGLQDLREQGLLQEQLSRKEAELEALRASNYDDIAHMEELRYALERDKAYLDTIGTLTHRAANSPNLNDTQQLRLDLEEQMRMLR